MEPFETFEHEGIRCELHYDEFAGNPYQEFDQLSRLLAEDLEYDFGQEYVPYDRPASEVSSAVTVRWLTTFGGFAVALPFYLADYGSGGLRAWLTEPSDDPETGYIVVTREAVVENWGDLSPESVARAENLARAEFSEFASWAEGGACGFVVAPGEDDEESVWGFYDRDYCEKEAREVASWIAHERRVNEEPPDMAEVLHSTR